MLFLPFVLPICIWVAWSDMARMKIPNIAVLALTGVFLVLGPIMFPLAEFGWRLVGGVVVLAIGFIMSQLRLVGAGDAKFAAAMAPFFAVQDLSFALMLFAAMLIMAFFTHRTARAIPAVRGLAPEWESWTNKKFPMGLALSTTLAIYISLVAYLHG